MSVEQISLALNTQGLDPTTKLVLIGLANHAHADGTNAFPRVATLAVYVGVGVRSVQYHLRKLQDLGLIKLTDRARGQRPNTYSLQIWGADIAPHEDEGVQPSSQKGDAEFTPGVQPSSQGGAVHFIQNRKEPSVEPSKNQQPRKVVSGNDEAFVTFWKIFPRREGKGAARKAFDGAVARAGVDAVIAGATRLRDDPHRAEHILPHPSTWLNQDRWEDDPYPPPPSNGHTIGDKKAGVRELIRELEARYDDVGRGRTVGPPVQPVLAERGHVEGDGGVVGA